MRILEIRITDILTKNKNTIYEIRILYVYDFVVT